MEINSYTIEELENILKEKEKRYSLDDILSNDPLCLLGINKPIVKSKSEDEKLIESFEEINKYYEAHGKEPKKSKELFERKLASRLENLRNDLDKINKLIQIDRYNLLNLFSEAKNIDDIFSNDFLGIFSEIDNTNLFDIKYISVKEERNDADFVAKRSICKEFTKYENSFIKVHKEIASGERLIIPFNIKNLNPGSYFILNGQLMYVESIDKSQGKMNFKTGNRIREDGRTRCIFENGTESNMLYRSLEKALNLKGKSVTKLATEISSQVLSEINSCDRECGWVYVLKSKSTNPNISSIPNLYKIGYSKNKVAYRIKNAERESTYLMNEVEIVATFKCYNMNTYKLEQLIHTFFESVCLNIEVIDLNGKIQKPREWFTVPYSEIEKAINFIINGTIFKYQYDKELKKIIEV